MDSKTLLAKLRDDSPDGPAARLAALIVDDLLARPLRELLEPSTTVTSARAFVLAWVSSDAAGARVEKAIEDGLTKLARQEEPLSELLPEPVLDGVRSFLRTPHAPDRELLLRVVDREPVRLLIRELLVDALVAFGKKLRSPVTENPIARGLGGLGRMAKESAKARSGSLGALASGVYGAVSGEVERQLEKRAAEFADSALSGVLQRLVDNLAAPGRGAEQAELRLALLDGILELTGDEVAAEVRRAGPVAVSRRLRKSLAAWAKEPSSSKQLQDALEAALAGELDRPLGELLAELGLKETFVEHALPVARARTAGVVRGAPFAAWLTALVEEG